MKCSPWGALFDWDGVIVDSSRQHGEAWERLAREEKQPLPPDHFVRGFGMKNEVIIPDILEWTHDVGEISRISLRKEALYRDVLRESDMAPLPGVQAWLHRLEDEGIPCAVASSTHRENIDLALDITGLRHAFKAVISAENVTRGKPHPEVFLTAAAALGLPPERCIVFEDAHVGIEAGKAGGMRVIAVATTHEIDALRKADLAVHRLDEIDFDIVTAWFAD